MKALFDKHCCDVLNAALLFELLRGLRGIDELKKTEIVVNTKLGNSR